MFKKLRKKCKDPVYSRLLIEFRAVPYAGVSHVLEYRINPNQNLTYSREFKILGISFKIKLKYRPKWIRAERFMCTSISPEYDVYSDVHIMPIFIDTRSDLEFYKKKYETVGEFIRRALLMPSEIDLEEYRIERLNYLRRNTIWK